MHIQLHFLEQTINSTKLIVSNNKHLRVKILHKQFLSNITHKLIKLFRLAFETYENFNQY